MKWAGNLEMKTRSRGWKKKKKRFKFVYKKLLDRIPFIKQKHIWYFTAYDFIYNILGQLKKSSRKQISGSSREVVGVMELFYIFYVLNTWRYLSELKFTLKKVNFTAYKLYLSDCFVYRKYIILISLKL